MCQSSQQSILWHMNEIFSIYLCSYMRKGPSARSISKQLLLIPIIACYRRVFVRVIPRKFQSTLIDCERTMMTISTFFLSFYIRRSDSLSSVDKTCIAHCVRGTTYRRMQSYAQEKNMSLRFQCVPMKKYTLCLLLCSTDSNTSLRNRN